MDLEINQESQQQSSVNTVPIEVLQPHIYPLNIRIFLWLIAVFSVVLITHFVCFELSLHIALGQKLRSAQKAFSRKQYLDSASQYEKIIALYPHVKKARMRLAESYFALIKLNDAANYYAAGLSWIQERTYNKDEQKEIMQYLPEAYHQHFKSLFTKGC